MIMAVIMAGGTGGITSHHIVCISHQVMSSTYALAYPMIQSDPSLIRISENIVIVIVNINVIGPPTHPSRLSICAAASIICAASSPCSSVFPHTHSAQNSSS